MVDIVFGFLYVFEGVRVECVIFWLWGGKFGFGLDMVGIWREYFFVVVEEEME